MVRAFKTYGRRNVTKERIIRILPEREKHDHLQIRYRGFQKRYQQNIYRKMTDKIDRLGEWESKGGLRYEWGVMMINILD